MLERQHQRQGIVGVRSWNADGRIGVEYDLATGRRGHAEALVEGKFIEVGDAGKASSTDIAPVINPTA